VVKKILRGRPTPRTIAEHFPRPGHRRHYDARLQAQWHTTLFAALVAAKGKAVTEMKTGEVIGECLPRHRAKESIRFLKRIDRTVAKHLKVRVICDNYKTHKTKEVETWLTRHKRFKLHFTPTSSSWNQSRRASVRRDHPPAHPAACSRASPTLKPL
jgi:hypothetical protein